MNTISLLSPRKDIAFDVFPFHLLRRDPWSRPRSEDPSGALTRDPFCATPRLQINHNPPYAETTSIEFQKKGTGKEASSWKEDYAVQEMKKHVSGAASNDIFS